MKKPIFFLLGLVLLLGACKKDDEAKSKTDLLTSGKWKIVASTASFTLPGAGTQTFDLLTLLNDCEKDNHGIFQTGGVFVGDEGATKCDVGDPQQTNGTWQLNPDETRLKVVGGGFDLDAEILELTSSKLKVKYTTNVNGITADTETEFMNF